jgi:hypothetical protein
MLWILHVQQKTYGAEVGDARPREEQENYKNEQTCEKCSDPATLPRPSRRDAAQFAAG